MVFRDILAFVFLDDATAPSLAVTLDALNRQTIGPNRIAVVCVDSCSYPDIAGFRLRQDEFARHSALSVSVVQCPAHTPIVDSARKALSFAASMAFHYALCLLSGDHVEADFLAAAVAAGARARSGKPVILAADACPVEVGEPAMAPLFDSSRVLDQPIIAAQIAAQPPQHRVLCLYSRAALSFQTQHVIHFVNFASWFHKSIFALNCSIVYLRRAAGRVQFNALTDPFADIIERYYLLKRLELFHRFFCGEEDLAAFLQPQVQRDLYGALSQLALQYGTDQLNGGNGDLAKRLRELSEIIRDETRQAHCQEHIG